MRQPANLRLQMVMKQPIFRGEAIVPKDKKEPYPFQTDQVIRYMRWR